MAEKKKASEDKAEVKEPKPSCYEEAIQQIADATKKLTEAGAGGQQAGQLAFAVWEKCG